PNTPPLSLHDALPILAPPATVTDTLYTPVVAKPGYTVVKPPLAPVTVPPGVVRAPKFHVTVSVSVPTPPANVPLKVIGVLVGAMEPGTGFVITAVNVAFAMLKV